MSSTSFGSDKIERSPEKNLTEMTADSLITNDSLSQSLSESIGGNLPANKLVIKSL